MKAARANAAWHPGGGGSGSERALLAAVPLPLELQRPEVLPRQLQQLAPLLPYAHALHQRERRKATLGALTAGCLTVGEAGVGVGSGPDGGARRVLGVAAGLGLPEMGTQLALENADDRVAGRGRALGYSQ